MIEYFISFIVGLLIGVLIKTSKQDALSNLISWMPHRIGHWLIKLKEMDEQTIILEEAINQIAHNKKSDDVVHQSDECFAVTLLMDRARIGELTIRGIRRVSTDEYGDMDIMSDHSEKIPANYWETHQLNLDAILNSGLGLRVQTEAREGINVSSDKKPLYGNLRVQKRAINLLWPNTK